MNEKVYYYLKLEETYFNQKIEKALRQMPSGAEMLICYLKMQLKYISSEGFIIYSGIYDMIEKEIALEIDEREDIVKLTLTALIKWGYIDQIENGLYLKDVQKRIGSKTDAALRMEKHRNKIKLLENKCNNVTKRYKNVTQYRDREELEKDIEKNTYGELNNVFLSKNEYNKLLEDYEKSVILDYIERLSTYIPNKKGKSYIDHNAVIRSWLNKDRIEKKQKPTEFKEVKREPLND